MKTETKTEAKLPKDAEAKAPRRRKRNQKFSLPPQPALPVKALWEMATPEQRLKAHEASVAIMEYWLGRITKQELAARLKTSPLRIWQLSQQAISGMVAGLLIQPKTRAPRGAKNMGLQQPKDPENDPKILRERIAKLEKQVWAQERLISILREMPGCKDAKIPMETPEVHPSQEGTKPDAKSQTKKTTSPIPAGVRHEGQPDRAGTQTEDLAKRTRAST